MGIHAKAHAKSGYVDLGGGLHMPSEWTITADEDEPYLYVVRLEVVYRDGRLVCKQLVASEKDGGESVSSEGLRAIPVSTIIRKGINLYPWLMRMEKIKGGVKGSPIDLPRDITSQGPTDEALRFVAAAYRLAYAFHEPPTNGVMERLRLNRSTAGKWVMLARDRGFLGPTEERRPGEQKKSKRRRKGS